MDDVIISTARPWRQKKPLRKPNIASFFILEMTRGKQAPDQFDLSNGLLVDDDHHEDYRNYGMRTGTRAKRLFDLDVP